MGLEAVISPIIKSSAKSLVNFDLAVDPLLDQLQKSCPSKSELDKIIAKKNQMSQALTQVQKGLTTLTDTSTTLTGILTVADVAVKVIKALPVPSSVPPGVGIPLNVINGFSSALIKLADLIKAGKVTVAQIAPATKIMTTNIAKIQDKLSKLDGLLAKCLEEQTAGMTDDEKEAYFESLGINLNSNTTAGDGTQPGESLEDRLSPNSTNPYVYKGYTITLDTNSGNKFSFPERRAIGTNEDGEKIVGPWSYSASTQVLLDGVKFEIDKLNRLALKAADEAARIEAARLEAQRRADEIRQAQEAKLKQELDLAFNQGLYTAKNSGTLDSNPYIRDVRQDLKAKWDEGFNSASITNTSPNLTSTSAFAPSNSNSFTPPASTPDYTPFNGPGTVDGEVRFQGGKYFRYLSQSKKWVDHYPSYEPFTIKGNYNGETNIKETSGTDSDGLPVTFKDKYKWNQTLFKWIFDSRETTAGGK